MIRWAYANSEDDKCRYVLGEVGKRNLVCVGVNPSKAKPDELDPTARRVKQRAESLGYDGYLLVNLYPQRATDPDELHGEEDFDRPIAEENYAAIAEVFAQESFDIWAAWGDLIQTREYLRECLLTIYDVFSNTVKDSGPKWLRAGDLTKKGNPRHPLYLASAAEMHEFDIHKYLYGACGE